MTAALGLLRKSLPDLAATQHVGELRVGTVSAEPMSDEAWEGKYGLPSAGDGA